MRRIVTPVFSIDIPYIEGINLDTFSKIVVDNTETVKQFRRFLERKFNEIEDVNNKEFTDAFLKNIELELEDELLKLKSEFKKLRAQKAFRLLQRQLPGLRLLWLL